MTPDEPRHGPDHVHSTDERLKEQVPEEVVAAGAVTNVMTFLDGIDFPATREDVERVARENGADESALQEIRRLPADRRYRDPSDLIAAIGDEVQGL